MVPGHGYAESLGALSIGNASTSSQKCEKLGATSAVEPATSGPQPNSSSKPPSRQGPTSSTSSCGAVFADAEQTGQPIQAFNCNPNSFTASQSNWDGFRGTHLGTHDFHEIRRLTSTSSATSSLIALSWIVALIAACTVEDTGSWKDQQDELDPTNSYRKGFGIDQPESRGMVQCAC